jgi:lipid-binding SYLF domain-containing protein
MESRKHLEKQPMRTARHAALVGLIGTCLAACQSSGMQSASSAADAENKARADVNDRLANATDSLAQFRSNTPDSVADRPRCVAMVPGLIKAGFIVGGEGGKGFATCKTEHGTWSPPAPITIGGGSIGAQVGANSSDWLMLVMTDKAQRALVNGHFKVGVDASATAGPVGTGAGAATDVQGGDTVSYSRSRGLFAGATLNGASIGQDDDSTRVLYGKAVSMRDILEGRERMPADQQAQRFVAEVRKDYGHRPVASSEDMTPGSTASDSR